MFLLKYQIIRYDNKLSEDDQLFFSFMNIIGCLFENLISLENEYVPLDYTKYHDIADVNLPLIDFYEDKKKNIVTNKFMSLLLYTGEGLYPYNPYGGKSY